MLFQRLFGGTEDKKRLATMYYDGQKKVLEIGCSVGNVSEVFTQYEHVRFTGIDIDSNALKHAKKRLARWTNFEFKNVSLSDLAKSGEKFDYVLFANILHHVDDKTALDLLKEARLLLSEDSTLIVMEPEKIKDGYNLIYRFFYMLEKGEFRRHKNDLQGLITKAGLNVKKTSDVVVHPDSLPSLKVGVISMFITKNNCRLSSL